MAEQKSFSLLVALDNPPFLDSGSPLEGRLQALSRQFIHHTDVPSDEAQIIARMKEADAVLNSRATVRFTREVLASCPQLKILSRAGTGVDHIDLNAARELGITVTNSPGCGTPYVAEHALALALAVSRRIFQNDQQVRQGNWTRSFINELYQKTLGVVGTGAIGQRMIQLGKGIGMKVIAWTVHPSPERASQYGVEFVPIEELLRQSDVVSLHVELSPLTERLIGRQELDLMKPSAVLVNTARGPLVDETALIDALEQGKIAGAGLDVFDIEPLPAGHPFTRLDNVVLASHQGLFSRNAVIRAIEMAVESLESFTRGNPVYTVVTGTRR
jgi:D-3-phosphoglycerate dehydrogenase